LKVYFYILFYGFFALVSYDANGNNTFESTRVRVAYNAINLPQQVQLLGGRGIKNVYAADGRKLKSEAKQGSEYIKEGTKTYCGNLVFDINDELDYIIFPEGRILHNNGSYTFEYHLKDHLGSTRVAFTASPDPSKGGEIEVVQENSYYPFGAPISDLSWSPKSTNKYLRESKEYISDFDFNKYDYSARYYDPYVAKFLNIDPMAGEYYSISPYAFVAGNPIKLIDPTGMIWDESSLEEVRRLKGNLNNRITELNSKMESYQNMIKSETLNDADIKIYTKEISAFKDMFSHLETSMKDIDKLGDDQKHTYALNSNENTKDGYVLKGMDGKINIVGDGMELTVHEITHVRQSLDVEKFNFNPKNNRLQYIAPGAEIQAKAEVEAYQMQFSVKRTDFGSGLNLRSPNEITPQIIGNKRRHNGTLVYPDIYNKYVKR
jgi:RHS repeat-associated protein